MQTTITFAEFIVLVTFFEKLNETDEYRKARREYDRAYSWNGTATQEEKENAAAKYLPIVLNYKWAVESVEIFCRPTMDPVKGYHILDGNQWSKISKEIDAVLNTPIEKTITVEEIFY